MHVLKELIVVVEDGPELQSRSERSFSSSIDELLDGSDFLNQKSSSLFRTFSSGSAQSTASDSLSLFPEEFDFAFTSSPDSNPESEVSESLVNNLWDLCFEEAPQRPNWNMLEQEPRDEEISFGQEFPHLHAHALQRLDAHALRLRINLLKGLDVSEGNVSPLPREARNIEAPRQKQPDRRNRIDVVSELSSKIKMQLRRRSCRTIKQSPASELLTRSPESVTENSETPGHVDRTSHGLRCKLSTRYLVRAQSTPRSLSMQKSMLDSNSSPTSLSPSEHGGRLQSNTMKSIRANTTVSSYTSKPSCMKRLRKLDMESMRSHKSAALRSFEKEQLKHAETTLALQSSIRFQTDSKTSTSVVSPPGSLVEEVKEVFSNKLDIAQSSFRNLTSLIYLNLNTDFASEEESQQGQINSMEK